MERRAAGFAGSVRQPGHPYGLDALQKGLITPAQFRPQLRDRRRGIDHRRARLAATAAVVNAYRAA